MSQHLFKRILSGIGIAVLCLASFNGHSATVKNATATSSTIKKVTSQTQRVNVTRRFTTSSATSVTISPIITNASLPSAYTREPNSGDVVQAVINGLDAITEKVIPAVIEDNNLDHVEYETTLAQGTLQAKVWPDKKWKDCSEFKVTFEAEADFPVGTHDVTADFETNRVVDTDWDVEDAELGVAVEVELDWGDDADSWSCLGWDIVTALENLIGNTRMGAYAYGLGGELKVQMKDASQSVIAISAVNNADLSFDDVDLTKNDAFNWLIDAGLTIADFFGGSCSSLDECVNDIIEDELNKKDLLNNVKTGLNDAISNTATLQGGTDGEFDIDYDVLLAALSTNSSNQFSTGWDAELSSDDEDDCAADLAETTYGAIASDTLGGDVDLTIGFPLISQAAYQIGKQGLFCRSFSGTVESDDATDAAADADTGNDEANAAIGKFTDAVTNYGSFSASYSGQLVPDGTLVIRNADEDNQVTVFLPMRLEDVEVSSVITGTQSTTGGSEITADLELTAELDVSCDNGLYLKPVSAALTDLSGSVEFDGRTVNASDFEDDLQEAAEGILDDIEAITLIQKINSLDALGLGIEIDDVEIDSNSIHVAVNLTDDLDACDDDDDVTGGGGGGPSDPTGPKGGRYIFDPLDDDDEETDLNDGDMEAAEMQSM